MNKISIMIMAVLLLLAPLAAGTLTVTSPNGGESLVLGSPGRITWTAVGVRDNVKLILLNADNSIYGVIVRDLAPGSSPYPWTVGDTEIGRAPVGNYKVRISTMDGGTKDVSNAAFTLAAAAPSSSPSLYLNEPNRNRSWRPGSFHWIHWNIRGSLPSLIQLTLRREGAPEAEGPVLRIADGAGSRGNEGDFNWYIPPTLAEGRYFVRARVTAALIADSEIFAISAGGDPGATEGNAIWVNADLALVGVGVEYYNGNIVAWVKNNGPDRLRSHLVKFRVSFPESGSSRNIAKELSIQVGQEVSVPLMALEARFIPSTGLRVIVDIEPAVYNIRDTGRLNQHRDVRVFAH